MPVPVIELDSIDRVQHDEIPKGENGGRGFLRDSQRAAWTCRARLLTTAGEQQTARSAKLTRRFGTNEPSSRTAQLLLVYVPGMRFDA
jgi:hypothetical protein